ncbi:MAG: UDP-3-O-acyl-N-acetylglucosamine deacetylase [Verrucomicrobiota bacterium]
MASLKQTTVRDAQSVKGSALHTGSDVTLTVRPAAANTGFIFKRTDLADEPTVTAHIDHVKQVERATTLGEGSVKIHTVEHLLSALRGLGIDNAHIEINANEPPSATVSGKLFVELLERAGKTELDAPVAEYELTDPVRVTSRDGGYVIAWPSDRFEISCTNANHLGKHTQFRTWNPETGNYAKEIAQARTFVFYEEVQPLMDKGLIKGGSLENAVVIRGDAVLSREPLRYEDEFVRHKILDLIGDLSLFPCGSRPTSTQSSQPRAQRRAGARNLQAIQAAPGPARAGRGRTRRRGQHGRRRHHARAAAPLPLPHDRPHPRLRGHDQGPPGKRPSP